MALTAQVEIHPVEKSTLHTYITVQWTRDGRHILSDGDNIQQCLVVCALDWKYSIGFAHNVRTCPPNLTFRWYTELPIPTRQRARQRTCVEHDTSTRTLEWMDAGSPQARQAKRMRSWPVHSSCLARCQRILCCLVALHRECCHRTQCQTSIYTKFLFYGVEKSEHKSKQSFANDSHAGDERMRGCGRARTTYSL